jgi:hypothetical protein
MRRGLAVGLLAAAIALSAGFVPETADAGRYEVRKEIRDVERAKIKAAQNLKRCETRECADREMRKGYVKVEREKREARAAVRRDIREDYYRDRYYRGDDRWYRDGRYWDRYEYERRYYRNRKDDDDSDFLKGAIVGAAVVGVAVAISK